MFKSVEYAGFEGHPELRQLAERASAALGGVIRTWRDEVHVTWRPARPDSDAVLEVTLELSLPNAAGSVTGRIRGRDFEPGEEGYLRMSLADTWLDLLDVLIAQMEANREEWFADPVEA